MTPSHNNLSTDEAVSLTKKFFKGQLNTQTLTPFPSLHPTSILKRTLTPFPDMAQPLGREEQLGTALWPPEKVREQPMSSLGKDWGGGEGEDVEMGDGAISQVAD